MRRTARKTPKLPRILWAALLSAVFLAVILGIIQVKGSLFITSPWRVNLVYHTDPPAVISISPKTEEPLILITLPESVYAQVPGGYGPYRLGAVWQLGELEGRPDLFQNTVADVLGVKIHTFLGKNEPRRLAETPAELFESLKKAFWLSEVLFDKQLVQLNFLDRLILTWRLTQQRPGAVLTYAAHLDNRLFTTAKLPDGTVVKKINLEALSSYLEQKFEDEKIRKEGLTVAVINSTETAGIAQKFARIVTNLGSKVISIGTEKKNLSGCQIEASQTNLKSELVRYLAQEYNCKKIISETGVAADLVIWVGESFAQRWQMPPPAWFGD